jgi:broad specificity phosphatase PhoE
MLSLSRRCAVLLTGLIALVPLAPRADEAGLAALKSGGHVMIVRHGLTTPGFGDPPGFRLDDCKTQRNLVEEGREQSRTLGRLLRERRIPIERVVSSQWCRARETAALIDAGDVGVLATSDNLYGRPQLREAQIKALREAIAAWNGQGNLLIVSHGSVIFSLLGRSPSEAEGFVLKPTPGKEPGFAVVGMIGPRG